MSFRGDDQRYGHVPPVQYPVAGQQHQHAQEQSSYATRRQSFDNGDDTTPFGAGQHQSYQGNMNNETRAAGGDELFLGGQPSSNSQTGYVQNSAISGYQHQYAAQTPTTQAAYNPQAYAQSPPQQSLPFNPHPSTSHYQTQSTAAYSPTIGATNYTPAPYNPADFSGTTGSTPQRQPSYAGYSGYQPQQPYTAPSPSLNQSGYWQGQQQYTTGSTSQATTPGATYSSYDTTPTNTTNDAAYSAYASQPGHIAQTMASTTAGPSESSYSTSSSQVPYPSYSQIPVGPNYAAHDPNSFINRQSRASSSASPLASPQFHPPASPGLQRHPTNARLPNPPADSHNQESSWQASNGSYSQGTSEHVTQENIIQDIEAELGNVAGRQRPAGLDQRNGAFADNEMQNLRRLESTASYHSAATTVASPDDPSGVNRYSSNASTLHRNSSLNSGVPYPDDGGDESDPEGAAGVMAMLQADADDRRLSGPVSFPYFSQPEVSVQPPPLPNLQEEPSSDSDYNTTDLGLYGGGYPGQMNYDMGGSLDAIHEHATDSTPRINHASQRSQGSNHYPAFEQADIDYGGTGGLQAPTTHRMSFDEGDERVSTHSRQSSESPSKDDYPDMFYHPGLTNRPLPAIPNNPNPVAGSDSSSLLSVQSPQRPNYQHNYSLSTDSRPYSGPDAQYGQNAMQLQVERSISLSSHSTAPQVHMPMRSRTDAEERNNRMRYVRQQSQQGQNQGQLSPGGPVYENLPEIAGSDSNYDEITLPSGRRKKFVPDKITLLDTAMCTEPWALSGISYWLREMAEGEPDLKRKSVEDGLVRLFSLKVPTMNVADAEALSLRVVNLMLEAGILVPEEEWLKFGQGTLSGVLWQLTGSGCYAPKLHESDGLNHELFTRCYSFHCGRTLKKANLDEVLSEGVKKVDWASFYNLKKEDIEGKHKKEIERQNVLHEIVTSEEEYIDQLEVLRILYRDQLIKAVPRIIAGGRIGKFVTAVFGKVDGIVQVNKDHLLAQLKYRQKEQGPWIVGYSDLFREWIRKARSVYVEYAASFPYAVYLIKREEERNYMFKQFLDNNRQHPRSKRLDWSTFLKAPITRFQRYNLLLMTSMKNMISDSEEKVNLIKAMDEIRNIGLEADAKVDEMTKKVNMIELDSMLVLRPGFHADLNLDHLGRELIFQGDMQRMGSKGVRWVDTHALLFDHYFILAKLVLPKDGRLDRKFDVSKEPIPMPLLFLESSTDEPIAKQKGIATPLTRAAGSTPDFKKTSDSKLNKVTSNNGDRPGLEHTATSSSLNSNRLAPTNSTEEGKILYPFRVKHLGHDVYTLFASSSQSRQDWCDKIIEAKTRHAKALHAQNAEPFRLRVMADSAFAYDSAAAGIGKFGAVHIRGTPLDRALRELEATFGPGRGPPPICRAAVHCATGFSAYGKNMIAVGTDIGVCVAEAGDQRGWQKTISSAKVTQIAVLEEFSVFLVLTDRNLISYPLDVVAPPSNFPTPANDNHRRAPHRLAKDVSFFATARMKERMLVFYKKKEGLHSTFKVLEPVFQKATEKKARLFSGRRGAGTTETFRDYDDFYLPIECYSLNIFNAYISISTAKGFELLTLDKKVPMSIPDIKMPAIANIASRIREQRPLGMFKLNDQEFLLAYEDCAVYVDKHGDVSRSVIMEYSGRQKKAKGATMYGQYLVLINEDYIEIRNAENGRLRQIIAGRDVRVLDYGFRGPTGGNNQPAGAPNGYVSDPANPDGSNSRGTVKICMAHPEIAGQQLVLEMLLNTGHTEAR